MQHLDRHPDAFERPEEDRVFREVDNRRIGIGADSWVAQVFGVHMTDADGWVQVAPEDDPTHSVIVRVWPGTTGTDVAQALAHWSAVVEEERPPVIEAPRVTTH